MNSPGNTPSTLLRVAFPRVRNNATNGENASACATSLATVAQHGGLKALAALALSRNSDATARATRGEKGTETAQQAVTRGTLLRLAETEGVGRQLIDRLTDADMEASAGLPDEALADLLRDLRDSDLRRRGIRPASETAHGACQHCGPVWLDEGIATLASHAGGLARVVGCPWCFVTDRACIPRPLVTCETCRHFVADQNNAQGGLGACRAPIVFGYGEPPTYPAAERSCTEWLPLSVTAML